MTEPQDPRFNKRRHFLVTGVILFLGLCIVGILTKGLTIDQTKVPSVLIDKPASPFKVDWLQGQQFLAQASGKSFRLEDLKGKPLVLNFWASWCHSCREEAKDFEAFWQKHKGEDVAVVGIAIQDTPEAALEFAKYFGKTYMLGLDTDGHAAIDYGVTGVPETFFIDRQGLIRHKEAGPVSTALLDKMLTEIKR